MQRLTPPSAHSRALITPEGLLIRSITISLTTIAVITTDLSPARTPDPRTTTGTEPASLANLQRLASDAG